MSQSGSNNTLRILIGVAALLALIAVLLFVFNIPGRFFGGDEVATDPTQQAEGTDTPNGQDGAAGAATPRSGEQPGDQPPQEGTPPAGDQPGDQPPQEGTPPAGDQPGDQPPQEATPAPQPTQAPPQDVSNANPAVVPANTPLESNGWLYDFAQPEYANYFIGNFGQLQTQQGRTVVVLVRAVNRTGQAQPLPADFFVLKDAQGRIYEAQPQASTAYLTLFGRGPAGAADLSHEEPVPADGLTRSIPLIFDVPPDATDLVLFARSNPDQGWLVLQNVQ
jgi:outer membrane biosynthesis protein TonB